MRLHKRTAPDPLAAAFALTLLNTAAGATVRALTTGLQ